MLLGAGAVVAVAAAAVGVIALRSDGSGGSGGTGGAGALRDVCPSTITVQADWLPHAELGYLYQLVGDGYTVDVAGAAVEGPLVDHDGRDTGVRLRIASGGAATGFEPASSLMYRDDGALLGIAHTSESVRFSTTAPTVAVESGLERNPQMIMWDPATYPDVAGIADLAAQRVLVRAFQGELFVDFLVGTGVLLGDQVDSSFTGGPELFVQDEGRSAQQGFATSDEILFEQLDPTWRKPISFQYLDEVGWDDYAQSVVVKPETVGAEADCLTKLVPMLQQATADFVAAPQHAIDVILDAVAQYGGNFGWTYTQEEADAAVAVMGRDGIVAAGADGVLGNFDLARVGRQADAAAPLVTAQGGEVRTAIRADDIATNQFIDTSIDR